MRARLDGLRLGDQTARLQGRITLNPVYHADPIGTLVLPAIIIFGPFFGFSFFSGFLIGWARPTPVITRNFRRILRDDNLTTLAGPISNLILVVIAFIILGVMAIALPDGRQIVLASLVAIRHPEAVPFTHPVALLCALAILINMSLFYFNLLPIPPLDGSHLLRNLLPYNAAQQYDKMNVWISYLLMITVGGFLLGLLLWPSLNMIFAALVRL